MRLLSLHGFLAVLAAFLVVSASAQPSRPPNIILIMADDLGTETLGAYGGTSYETPVLDKMAKNGMRFSHAYAYPLCTPTRVSLMTGKYNFR
ncbi:MAG: sulfatase-like hydrolase/transferase, partial [Bacteroidota bacterium]